MTIMLTLRCTLLFATLSAALIAQPLAAADNAAVVAFAQAFSGTDEAAKRAAIPGVIALGKDEDDTVYRLLVQAVGDTQTHDVAVPALRARSGLSPNFFDHGPGYPGYPQSDAPADWSAWLAARTADKEHERILADLARRLAALASTSTTATAKGTASASATPAGASETQHEQVKAGPVPPSDLGRLSRIIFVDGSITIAHIVDRHRDANGKELTIEFIHRNGGGREVVAIERIARIEDDAP